MLGYLSVDIICSEEAKSFPRKSVSFEELFSESVSCKLRGTDNVLGQISEHISLPNGGYFVYNPSNNFRNTPGFENWEIYKQQSPFGAKICLVFVRGHYLFRGTNNVRGQISEHIFAANGGYCLYYPSNLFRNARNFEIV